MSEKLASTYTYKILVLGPTNAGKTTLLASMFYKLGLLNPEVGSTLLTTSGENQNTLYARYRSMARGEWLPGTNEVSEWKFSYNVWSPYNLEKYSVMQFSYLDYAGGRLMEPQSVGYQELLWRIQQADVLLVLLDGEKLLHVMQGRLESENFFDIDLRNILSCVFQGKAPTHFVVTKWDILKPFYSLGDLKTFLLENDMFRWHIKGQKRIIRLIPVSAFGDEFAKRLPDGTMVRIPGKQPQPYYVEMPLACVLIDQFTHQLQQPIQKFKEGRNSPLLSFLGRRGTLKTIIMLGGGISRFFQTVQIHPLLMAGTITVNMVLDFVELYGKNEDRRRKRASNKTKRLLRIREKYLRSVKNQQTATDYAIICCMALVQKLEEDFPDSFLT